MRKLLTFLMLTLVSTSGLIAATFTTTQDGDWDDPATWDLGSVPDMEADPSNEVIIAHNLTRNGSLLITSTASITILTGAKLVITGDLRSNDTSILVVDPGGSLSAYSLDVAGFDAIVELLGTVALDDFVLSATQYPIYLSGTLTVSNDMALNGDARFLSDGGTITVNNDLSLANSAELTMNAGALNVGHDLLVLGNSRLTTEEVIITVNNDLSIASSAELTMNTGALNVGHDLSVLGNSRFTTEEVTVDVGNDLTIESSARLTMKKGRLTVDQDLTMSGNARLSLNDTNVDVDGQSDLSGSTQITIDGGAIVNLGDLIQTGSADIIGVGTGGAIGFTSLSQANSSTTIQCINNLCNYNGGANGGTPPNPLDLATGTVFLPVELLSFQLEAQLDRAILTWTTASESNNEYFLIEHSRDGRSFAALTQVKGAGNSQELTYYGYTHEKLAAGTHYYRLWQFDYDGTYELLGTRKLVLTKGVDAPAILYPNPTRAGSHLQTTMAVENLHLYSSSGQLIATLEAPNSSLVLPASLPAGLYIIRWQQQDQQFAERLFINGN